jgi:1,4-alpha-glucan branching enzyme
MSYSPSKILELDGYLKDDIPNITNRYNVFKKRKDEIIAHEGGLDQFSKGYLKFGLTVSPSGQITYREWAPGAKEAVLIGDFSEHHPTFGSPRLTALDNWNRTSHPMTRNEYGVWEITIPPNSNGEPAIPHDSKLKVRTIASLRRISNPYHLPRSR